MRNILSIKGQPLHVLPTTRPGRWSLGFLGGFVAGLLVMMAAVASGQTGGDAFSDNWWLSAPAAVAAGCVIVAFVTGAFALLRRDRSVAVGISTLIGLLVVVLLVGEFVSPH